jgi:hypothetical protein
MEDDALEIESNMMASGKLKSKTEAGNKENIRYREQGGSSRLGRSLGDKMDDMARIIKELSNKISKMELEKTKNDHFPKKDFRRNPNPQIPQRPIKNEDQKIPTPLKSENFIGEKDLEDLEELEEEINNLGDDEPQPYLSRQDYEKLLNKENRLENDLNDSTSEDLIYQGIVDGIMAELQQKYNLRPRNKSIMITQKKKVLSRSKTNEIVSKDVEK